MSSDDSRRFATLSTSSIEYFSFLLTIISDYSKSQLFDTQPPQSLTSPPSTLLQALLAGYITSADTGSEDLVLASRAALAHYCTAATQNSIDVFNALSLVIKLNEGEDRIVVPALEVLGFLSDVDYWKGVSSES